MQVLCGNPLLSSLYLNYSNTAFTYNDLASTDTWNLEEVSKQMHRKDLYTGEAQIEPSRLWIQAQILLLYI